MSHKIAIVDDHLLFTKALEDMVNNFDGYEVMFCAENGKDFIDKISKQKHKIDVVLLYLIMYILIGLDSICFIFCHYEDI